MDDTEQNSAMKMSLTISAVCLFIQMYLWSTHWFCLLSVLRGVGVTEVHNIQLQLLHPSGDMWPVEKVTQCGIGQVSGRRRVCGGALDPECLGRIF